MRFQRTGPTLPCSILVSQIFHVIIRCRSIRKPGKVLQHLMVKTCEVSDILYDMSLFAYVVILSTISFKRNIIISIVGLGVLFATASKPG